MRDEATALVVGETGVRAEPSTGLGMEGWDCALRIVEAESEAEQEMGCDWIFMCGCVKAPEEIWTED